MRSVARYLFSSEQFWILSKTTENRITLSLAYQLPVSGVNRENLLFTSEDVELRVVFFKAFKYIWCVSIGPMKVQTRNSYLNFCNFRSITTLVFCFLANNVNLLSNLSWFYIIVVEVKLYTRCNSWFNMWQGLKIWVEFSHFKPNKSRVIRSDIWHHFSCW